MDQAVSSFELAKRIRETTGDLPAMPQVAAEALERLGEDEATAVELDLIISKDPSLATRVLKIANSSFYARENPVKSVRQAVVHVGFMTIRTVIVAAAMKGIYQKLGRHEEHLWRHAYGCGIAARVLARRTASIAPDLAFLTGLLHDIGKTILLIKMPEPMNRILQNVAAGRAASTRECEEAEFGFDHAAVGQLMARHWKFDADIEEAIGLHHVPEAAERNPGLCRLVAVADQACLKLGIGPTRSPDLDWTACDTGRELGLDPKSAPLVLGEIERAVADAQSQFRGIS